MTTVKARLAALSLLDRALAAMSDDELTAAVQAQPDDHRDALAKVAGVPAGADDTTWVASLRDAAHKGRINGGLEQIAAVLTDAALSDCVEQLGDAADAPTEEQLREVLPGLRERHGLPTTRLMLASAVCGEATASPILVRLLKTDDELKLPPVPARAAAPVRVDDRHSEAEREELRRSRRERREREQAEARARREQAARARSKH